MNGLPKLECHYLFGTKKARQCECFTWMLMVHVFEPCTRHWCPLWRAILPGLWSVTRFIGSLVDLDIRWGLPAIFRLRGRPCVCPNFLVNEENDMDITLAAFSAIPPDDAEGAKYNHQNNLLHARFKRRLIIYIYHRQPIYK